MDALTAASDVVLRKARESALFGKGPRLFAHPIVEPRPLLPSITTAVEPALITAMLNDSKFSLALSTRGKSSGISRALKSTRDLVPLERGREGVL
jgi:hypothetical protein